MTSYSLTIARYLAKKHSLLGSNDIEEAQISVIVDGCSDVYDKIRYSFPLRESDLSDHGNMKKLLLQRSI